MSGGSSTYVNNMGGWLKFVKNYVKYYKKSSMRKVLLIPCALGESTFADHWRTGKSLLGYLIANTNNCLDRSKLNKLMVSR